MSASGKADEEGRKVFLGGLSFDVSDRDLRTDFAKYGDIEDLQLPMGDGGKHKGFAFITYRDPKDADYACKEHHQRSYQGREISAKIVAPPPPPPANGDGADLSADELRSILKTSVGKKKY